jgi:hypothetical protein
MDPNKNGLLLRIVTGVLSCVLYLAYYILKLSLGKEKKEVYFEPAHLTPAPGVPIDSIRLSHALNPKTDLVRLKRYAKSEDPYIRRALARNPSLPRDELKKLTQDPDPFVTQEALSVYENRPFDVEESPLCK